MKFLIGGNEPINFGQEFGANWRPKLAHAVANYLLIWLILKDTTKVQDKYWASANIVNNHTAHYKND